MSEKKVKANKRPDYAPQRGPGHGPMAGGGEKAANFTVSLRRLIRAMRRTVRPQGHGSAIIRVISRVR